jgi:alkanesulfonate monooxygenase SsuD/methylene tetrahydromethanopterin reductase-like flavin-dependent oxidoreductase (luciferase family)
MDPEQYSVFAGSIEKGFAAAGGGKSLAQFDIAPFVRVIVADDVAAAMQPIRDQMALYIGGMGARGKNFYTDYATRLGYGEAALKIQDLYLDGRKGEAAAAVPAELIDACHLVGPAARIKDRVQRWLAAGKHGHVGSMLIGGDAKALEVMAEAVL